MGEQFRPRLNQLPQLIPEGLLAPTSWLEAHGYSRSQLAGYVARGWLESPARGVYRRPGSSLDWKHVVATLQQQVAEEMEPLVHVGGLSALEHRGMTHYARLGKGESVYLYGPTSLPAWAKAVRLDIKFLMRSDAMFASLRAWRTARGKWVDQAGASLDERALADRGLELLDFGRDEWKLVYSTEERAMFEMLAEVPARETLDHADLLMQSRVNLRPARVTRLLAACSSVKTKRLFLALAERHQHAWLKRLDWSAFNWGSGKRSLFPGAPMHPKYLISWPGFDDRA